MKIDNDKNFIFVKPSKRMVFVLIAALMCLDWMTEVSYANSSDTWLGFESEQSLVKVKNSSGATVAVVKKPMTIAYIESSADKPWDTWLGFKVSLRLSVLDEWEMQNFDPTQDSYQSPSYRKINPPGLPLFINLDFTKKWGQSYFTLRVPQDRTIYITNETTGSASCTNSVNAVLADPATSTDSIKNNCYNLPVSGFLSPILIFGYDTFWWNRVKLSLQYKIPFYDSSYGYQVRSEPNFAVSLSL